MAVSRAVGRVLRASVARPELGLSFARAAAALRPGQHRELATAAVFHGVAGYVRRAARACPAAVADGTGLGAAVERAVAGHLRTLADLAHLASVLDGVAPWLVVKGPVLAELVHEGPELRAYSDLDVLVPPAHFGEALEALEASGGRTLDRNWTLIGREMKGEVHVRLPLGTVADLHWSLLNDRAQRERFPVRTAGLFERCRTVALRGQSVRTLDEADTVVHLALHGLLSGGHRLLWLKDFERALARAQAPPPAIAERARAWGAGLALAGAVARTRPVIGCPPLPRSLHGSGAADRAWLALSGVVWRLVPAEREDGHGSLGRIVARSVRPGAAASARALASKGGSRLRHRRRPAARGRRLAPDAPGSDRFESGGVGARRSYLDAVVRHGA